MAELETTQTQQQTVDFGTSQGNLTKLLPRSAWNSQVSHLKAALKVKQILDKAELKAFNPDLQKSKT
ncbi:MAG: hypothetical protein IGS39_12250 [Calothrix sp. C42_A2020_038]|nr:hypothetical protein [Calothrix sp. C42_A2020_038]